jgi:methyl-accepting chemotaxis protein
METVLQNFSEAVTKNFTSQFENMAQVIEDTTQAQVEIKQQLINFTQQLESQFEAQSALIEKTNRAGEILGQSLESLESIAQKLKNSAEDITNAAQMLEESAISAKEGQEYLRETMQRQVETMSRTREELESTWEMVTENANDMVGHIRETINELTKGIGDNMVNALNTFDGKVAEVVERFSGSLFEAVQTIQEFPVLMTKMNENLNAIGKNLGLQKDIIADLKETTKSVVTDSIQTAIEASRRLNENTENIAATSSDLRTLMGNLSEVFGKNVGNYKQINEKSLSELSRMVDELIVEIRQGASMMGNDGSGKRDDNGLKKINAAIYERVSAMDKQLSEVHGLATQINPQIDKMDTTVTKMTDTLESIKSTKATTADSKGGWFKRGPKK